MIRPKLIIFLLFGLFITGIGYQTSYEQTPKIEDEAIVGIGSSSAKPIPNWLNNNFRWYIDGQITQKELLTSINWLLDNNFMHLSEKASREVHELRDQIQYLKERLAKTNATTTLDARKSGNESSAIGTLRTLSIISDIQPSSDRLISNIVKNSTKDVEKWNDAILEIQNEVSRTRNSLIIDTKAIDSVAHNLQTVVALCNTAFDKESKIIEAELDLISEGSEVSIAAWDDFSSDEESQDIVKNYWLGKTGKTIEKIESLEMGIIALKDYVQLIERKLYESEDIDSFFQEDIQKQQQKLQTLSNALKAQHDTAKAIIQNIRA